MRGTKAKRLRKAGLKSGPVKRVHKEYAPVDCSWRREKPHEVNEFTDGNLVRAHEKRVRRNAKRFDQALGYSDEQLAAARKWADDILESFPRESINALTERLHAMSIRKLQALAANEYGIKGAYRLRKDEIIKRILDHR